MASDEFALLMVDAFPELANAFSSVAAEMAATWFEMSAPESPYIAVTAPPIPTERLAQSTEWALGAPGDEALDRLEGTLQRAVHDGARNTIVVNVERTGSYWVRHARPDACAFCRLLATRHDNKRYWYSSSESAIDVVGRRGRARGNRAVGSRGYHDFCRCLAVEVREGQTYTPPDYVQAWNDEYKEARSNAGKSDLKSILAAWRQQGVK